MEKRENLQHKTLKGVSWSFIDNTVTQGITFLVSLVLARLLTPDEYGLIGIVSIFIAVFNSIVDSGFSNALIRKKDASDEDYNTVFVTNIAVCVVLFVLMILSAPLIGQLFKRPELIPLTRVMSVVVLINAFAIIQRTLLVKRIDFKTQTKISLIASVTSGLVGIFMAVTGKGVWSLVAQIITRQFLNTLMLWVYAKWYPRLQYSWKSFKELFGFGWKLMVSGLINTIWQELYQMVIGLYYSPQTLGQYTRAYQFGTTFSSNINAVVSRVTYPVLSSIQEDKERLKAAYRKIIKCTMLITFTLMLGMAAVAEPMVRVLVGDQWLPCVPFLQILCFNLMLIPLQSINLNMLQVQGRSDLFLKLEIVKKIIAVFPICLGIFINIYWMLAGSVFTACISYYLNAYYSGIFLNYGIREQLADVLPSLGIALLMAVVVHSLSFIEINSFILLPIQLVVGAVFMWCLCEWIKRDEYVEMKNIVLSTLNRYRHGR